MNMEADDVVVARPVVAVVLVAAVAAVTYVGIQLLLDGAIAPVETAVFVVVFTAVYVGGNWVLRRRARGDNGGPDADPDREGGDPGTE
jgi:predicted membrane-bound dolichyl-phosphate-mannose-protein mannosyltransferase